MNPKLKFDPGAFLRAYDRLDAALVRAGFPATSSWWRGELERFLRSGRRRWVVRAGRRAGKSSTLCRLAVGWALFGSWSVPLGDVAVVAFFSLDRDEASGRIRTIRDILTVLGIAHRETADEIELPDRRLKFSVKTASVRAVGFTAILVIADEMARWSSKDDGANPAREVAASYRPALATQPFGIEVCCSSPWSVVDYHHELFTQGDTAHQVASFAPTWVANPTLTEEQTHGLEEDIRVWSREYAAIPSAELSACFDPADVDASFRAEALGQPCQPLCVIDPNSGGSDAFGVGFAWWSLPVVEQPMGVRCEEGHFWDEVERKKVRTRRWIRFDDGPEHEIPIPEPIPELVVTGVSTIPSALGRGDVIVAEIARRCRQLGVRTVAGDQRESLFLEAAFRAEHLRYVPIPWTNQNKSESVRRLRRLMRDRQLVLPPVEQLRKELLNYAERLTNGTSKYAARGSGHDDLVSLLITAILAESERLLPGSPIIRQGGRFLVRDS